jgi:hypothetical protein
MPVQAIPKHSFGKGLFLFQSSRPPIPRQYVIMYVSMYISIPPTMI